MLHHSSVVLVHANFRQLTSRMRNNFSVSTLYTQLNIHFKLHILFLLYYILNLQWCYIYLEMYSTVYTYSLLPSPLQLLSLAVQKVQGSCSTKVCFKALICVVEWVRVGLRI